MNVHQLLESALDALVDEEAQGSLSVVMDVLARCVVRSDPDTTTLSITLGNRRCVLRVNEDFVTQQVRDANDALFVVAHECQHVLCEHGSIPRIPAVPDAVINIALDMQVNGAILRGLLEPTPGILGRLYRHDRFPELLLRPPSDVIDLLATHDPEARVFAGHPLRQLAEQIDRCPLTKARVEAILSDHLARIPQVDRPEAFTRAYLDGWCQAQEARSWLLRFIRLLGRDLHLAGWAHVPVLGDHSRRERAKTNRWSRAWGWSRSKHKDNLVLDPEPAPAKLMERFRTAAQRALQSWLEEFEPPPPIEDRSIIPAPGRRVQVLRAAGIIPIVYEHRRLPPVEPRLMVHLYLDVSGSMARERNWYGSLVRVLGDRLADPVWVWSTQVRQASRADVMSGKMPTDGGTRIEPVIEHAIAKGFERVLVISDGEFGLEAELLPERVKEAGLEVVFLLLRGRGSRVKRSRLEGFAVEVMEVGC